LITRPIWILGTLKRAQVSRLGDSRRHINISSTVRTLDAPKPPASTAKLDPFLRCQVVSRSIQDTKKPVLSPPSHSANGVGAGACITDGIPYGSPSVPCGEKIEASENFILSGCNAARSSLGAVEDCEFRS
jgi:hypothetical protein